MAVLCSHVFHASHPGWHCHLSLQPHDTVSRGLERDPRLRRWPSRRVTAAKLEFGVNKVSALTHAATRFNFKAQGGLI
jgi:hypothetical protein